jgi:hypothetical protein
MAHHYGLPIRVTLDEHRQPISFVWRGEVLQVVAILATWRLRDRWWVSPTAVALGLASKPASDRYYYRVECPGLAYYEIYYDAAVNWWVLDREID